MTKTNNTYIKTYVELFDATRSGLHALVYSFILNQSEYQKTNNPKIEQTFIQKSLNLGRKIVERILKELKEDGLIDYTKGYNYAGGKAYTTTKFTLKYQLQEVQTDTPNAEPIQNAETLDATEQTTYEQEPQTETVENHDEQVNNIGMSMMESDGYASEPTQISYTTTPNEKPQKKKKELWQIMKEEEPVRYEAALEELNEWVMKVGMYITDKEKFDKDYKTLVYELSIKYDCRQITTSNYLDWKNRKNAA